MRVNTIAFGILLSCAFASVTVATHVDDMTQLLNGLATNVQGSIDTSSIVGCGSESIFAAFEAGFLPIMDEVASCNPLDFSDIESKITALAKTIPDASKTCVNNNAEAKKLLTGLGIAGLTPDQIKSKVTSYVMDNLFSICGTFGDLNDKLKGGDFTGFGTEAGKVALDIFKSSRSHRQVAKDIVFALMSADKSSLDKVADIISGFSQPVNASVDAVALTKCMKQQLADATISVITDLTATVATFNISRITNSTFINSLIARISSAISQDQLQCFANSTEAYKLIAALGINITNIDKLMEHSIEYAATHVFQLFGLATKLNTDIASNNWNHFGVLVGQTVVEMINYNGTDRRSMETEFLQVAFSDSVKTFLSAIASVTSPGTDVTSIVACIDETLAGSVVSTLGALAKVGATCDLTKINQVRDIVEALMAQVTQTQAMCLSTDANLVKLVLSLASDGGNPQDTLMKLINFVTTNFSDACSFVGKLNEDFTKGDFDLAGKDFANQWKKMTA